MPEVQTVSRNSFNACILSYTQQLYNSLYCTGGKSFIDRYKGDTFYHATFFPTVNEETKQVHSVMVYVGSHPLRITNPNMSPNTPEYYRSGWTGQHSDYVSIAENIYTNCNYYGIDPQELKLVMACVPVPWTRVLYITLIGVNNDVKRIVGESWRLAVAAAVGGMPTAMYSGNVIYDSARGAVTYPAGWKLTHVEEKSSLAASLTLKFCFIAAQAPEYTKHAPAPFTSVISPDKMLPTPVVTALSPAFICASNLFTLNSIQQQGLVGFLEEVSDQSKAITVEYNAALRKRDNTPLAGVIRSMFPQDSKSPLAKVDTWGQFLEYLTPVLTETMNNKHDKAEQQSMDNLAKELYRAYEDGSLYLKLSGIGALVSYVNYMSRFPGGRVKIPDFGKVTKYTPAAIRAENSQMKSVFGLTMDKQAKKSKERPPGPSKPDESETAVAEAEAPKALSAQELVAQRLGESHRPAPEVDAKFIKTGPPPKVKPFVPFAEMIKAKLTGGKRERE